MSLNYFHDFLSNDIKNLIYKKVILENYSKVLSELSIKISHKIFYDSTFLRKGNHRVIYQSCRLQKRNRYIDDLLINYCNQNRIEHIRFQSNRFKRHKIYPFNIS